MDGWKDWFTSRGIIGSVIAGVSLVLGAFWGVKIDEATQQMIVDQWTAIATAIGSFSGLIMSIYGRVKATKRIGSPPTGD